MEDKFFEGLIHINVLYISECLIWVDCVTAESNRKTELLSCLLFSQQMFVVYHQVRRSINKWKERDIKQIAEKVVEK